MRTTKVFAAPHDAGGGFVLQGQDGQTVHVGEDENLHVVEILNHVRPPDEPIAHIGPAPVSHGSGMARDRPGEQTL